jgi:hypothetical protein
MGRTLILHIGPPKTATTFLQRRVFPEFKAVQCLVKPSVKLGDGTEVHFSDLFCSSPNIWKESCILDSVLNTIDAPQGDVIISSEGIYGGVASPQPWISDSLVEIGPLVKINRQNNGQPSPSCLASHLRVLKDVISAHGFSVLKVIFSVRRQDKKLASGYAQVSDRVRGASQRGFEKWIRNLTRHPAGYYAGGGDKLNYHYAWSRISSSVAIRNLLFIPFELLKSDSKEYIDLICKFLGSEIDVSKISMLSSKDRDNNRSFGDLSWRLSSPVRHGPRLRPTRLFQALGLPTRLPLRWPDFNRDQSIFLTPELSACILDCYRKSNRKLDQSIPYVDLKSFDYY